MIIRSASQHDTFGAWHTLHHVLDEKKESFHITKVIITDITPFILETTVCIELGVGLSAEEKTFFRFTFVSQRNSFVIEPAPPIYIKDIQRLSVRISDRNNEFITYNIYVENAIEEREF